MLGYSGPPYPQPHPLRVRGTTNLGLWLCGFAWMWVGGPELHSSAQPSSLRSALNGLHQGRACDRPNECGLHQFSSAILKAAGYLPTVIIVRGTFQHSGWQPSGVAAALWGAPLRLLTPSPSD